MVTKTIKFRRRFSFFGDTDLCVDAIQELFEIPNGTKIIYVTVSSRKIKNSYRCMFGEFIRPGYSRTVRELRVTLTSGGNRFFYVLPCVQSKLKKLFGLNVPFYVGIEYEEVCKK